ncbi:ABC transporter substrate-binding protein [Mesorhizobium sp. VK23B]|uniref:ABC transporter substrate-binding protein n=1 Tax=Mesorhizobium dulcispinae TaxID=3072316 RepID=A0ABU4X891_9HYPH|nr:MULTISPECIES: ABC transporter substrate-binding protein [unclassified Mesorhizobium]MDX8464630.1 ABC transporter substrate-binding protein [Mesorhizobium sp. VK23B]MDX8471016.1 ABC transporter substrate-binding protein [Mesorhizobium sp. VK23A]
MSRRLIAVAASALVVLVLPGCGRSADDTKSGQNAAGSSYVDITPAGTKSHGPIVWGVYRDVQTLDPAFSFDYPDHTAVSLLCESLLREQPDSSLSPGLAKLSRPNDLTIVLDIQPDAKFWDGNQVTADDVVYSLKRHMDSAVGSFYASTFSNVKGITATGPKQVTIDFTRPDYWFDGELSSRPGVVVEKAYAEQKAKAYGTPAGGAMCSGAYELKSWVPSTGLVVVPNPNYWRKDVHPKVEQITLKGLADEASMTSSLLSGEIAGTYPQAISTLAQLKASKTVSVYQSRGQHTDALIVSNLAGPLGDVRVRQALSLALDRQSVIDTVYKGAAKLPRWIANDGTFGDAKDTFQKAFDAAPEFKQDVAKAKQLVQDAGATGKTVTIGMSTSIAVTAGVSAAYQAAGKAIGIEVKLQSVSPENFINFFIDPNARKTVDAFPTLNFGDYPDPAGLMSTVVLPNASQNYANFSDDQLTKLLEGARRTGDPEARAKLVIQAQQRFNELLPWIPTVQPTNVLIMNNELSGAVASFAYINSSFADQLGGK